jgi:predicted RNA-binding protein YlxR (DUF448 family)
MRMSISERSVKHIPQRTCLACRQVKSKRELVRLVRTLDQGVEVDTGGRKTGRGAYLCPKQECWEVGLRGNQLERSLGVRLTPDNREQLIRFRENTLEL